MKNLLMLLNKKILPLFLAFALLFNLTTEAVAQYKSYTPNRTEVFKPYNAVQDNTRVAKVDATLKKVYRRTQEAFPPLSYEQVKAEIQKLDSNSLLDEAAYKAIYNEYLKEVNKQDKEVNQVFNLLKNEYHIESAFSEAYKQGNQSGKVCEGKVCFAYNNYIQGILRAEVYQGVGDDSSSKQYKWNREIMLAHVPAIYDAIEIAGVHRADQAKVQRYLRFVLEKASDYCDNDTYLVDIMPGLGYSFGGKSNGKKSDAQQGKERRRKQCEAVGKAMTALGIIGETGQDKLTNASIIYNIMKDTYKDDYGAITAVSGVSALIAVGTVGSYKYIDRFLTVDTLKGATDFGTVWNGCKWVLGLLSIQSWVEKGTTINNKLRGRGGRYLNQLGAIYQYIDEDASKAMGVSSYQLEVMKTNPSLGYNIAYGNVLEDLGRMISSTGTKQGNAIAARILAIYTSNVKTYGSAMNYVHTPLVAGVLSTGTIKGATAQYAAQKMNTLDWWDLNEATQRRVNNIVADYSGTVKRSKDEAKVKRNERNQKIIQASVWADMAVSAIFMGMLIASIPSMVRSIGSFVSNLSRIRAINAAGKANLLKITRVRIKALPVKPAQIKAALQVKRIEAARDAETLRVAKAAEAKAEALKSATEKIRKAKAPKGKPQTEQIQYTLLTKEGKALLANQNGTLTAVVGEGGGGASSAAKTLTLSEKAAIARRMASEQAAADARATLEAQTLEKETAAAIANQKPFKGNMLFNKPYKQLSPWRKWAFDTYYFKLNPAFKLTGQVTTGLARNPVKTTMMGSLPFGTTAEALVANPIGIYTTVSQQANSFSSIVNLAQEASTFGQVAKTVNTIGKIHNAVQPMTAAQSAMAMGGMLSLPKLVAVLNEPHTGSTGSMRIKGGSGNYSYAPAATAAKTEAAVNTETSEAAKPETLSPAITPVVKAADIPAENPPLLQITPLQPAATLTTDKLVAQSLPQGWSLQNGEKQNTKQKLVAEVGKPYPLPIGDIAHNITVADPFTSASFMFMPLILKFTNKVKNLKSTDKLKNPSNTKQANSFAATVLSKKEPLPSQLKAIVKSAASEDNKAMALFKLYLDGVLSKDVSKFNEEQRNLLTKKDILKLYDQGLFDQTFASLRDFYVPKQLALTPEEREQIEGTKEFVNNENELVPVGVLDWGTGETPFEAPKTNTDLIQKSVRPLTYIEDNAPDGIITKEGTYYRNNIPIYFRDAKGMLSSQPRMLLSYAKISAFSNFLSNIGLANKKGFLVPKGLVIAIDEEGKIKYCMPRGNMDIVEGNKKAKSIAIDQTESNRVSVDSELTSSDMVEMAYMLGKDKTIGFEVDLNNPDSFKIFLAFHALFIGNDAGNTLTGQFKGAVGNTGGSAAVNGIGGVGYLTPFVGGMLMKYISKIGHVPTILGVYGLALGALAYSIFGVGMDGFYSFPENPAAADFIKLGIPTTAMVLGGSILNTSIQTLLNIYKDPVARSTAHLQFANNKNYSRLAVSAITGLALISGLGLNWSVVVPAAAVLLLAAGALLFNTRIYDNFKKNVAKNKETKAKEQAKYEALSEQEKADLAESLKQAAIQDKILQKEFQKVYKKELSKKHEMKDISHRVSKLYASYAASLLVLTQSLKTVADKVANGNNGELLAVGILAAVTMPIILKALYNKVTGKPSNIGKELKKFAIPLTFFATTLVTMFYAQTGSALGMALTTLCLLTTTMMRVYSTDLIKSKKATDDQLSGLSIPLIALMTSLLVIAPSSGVAALASLAAVLMLYAGTAVPGQLDSARMQNFITSEYKSKKTDLAKEYEENNISKQEYKAQKERLSKEEKYMSSKGASKFSYLNGAGIVGIIMTVLGAFVLQDMANHPPVWMPEALTTWQHSVLDFVSKVTMNAGEKPSLALTRIILTYAALVAWWMTAENTHLIKAGIGLFKQKKITQENIDNNLVKAKDFDVNKNNAAIKLSAIDKDLKEINGIVFKHGKTSETKMTEILNKLFYLNNRLAAITEIIGAEKVAKSLEQLKFITSNLEEMISNNDLSFSYKQQFTKLKGALTNGSMHYVEEGMYKTPVSLKNYELGVMMVRELDHRALDIIKGNVAEDSYRKFIKYYTRAVQELTQYAQDNPIDSRRVNQQIRRMHEISSKLEKADHAKNTVIPKQDVVELLETIKLFNTSSRK